MKVQFITITQKADLIKRIESGDKEAVNILIREMDRLESLVKDFEIVIETAVGRYNSTLHKTPSKIS
jgi:nitrogen-specific signal transduction histidine kinase